MHRRTSRVGPTYSGVVAAKQPKDHYIPDNLIGRFSSRPEPRLRKSPLFVLRRGRVDAFQQIAENVAYETALYTLGQIWIDESVRMVDDVWTRLEQQMPKALSALEETDGLLDARLWSEALVPLIASLFVRTPDFGERFDLRMAVLEGGRHPLKHMDSITRARLFQLQRLFSPIMRASWCVLRFAQEAPLITSNLALAPLSLPQRPGWVIPISRQHALHLKPRPRTPRVWLTAPSHDTFVDVEVQYGSKELAHRINRAVARHAPSEIYGDPESLVLRYAEEMSGATSETERVKWDDLEVLRRNQHELVRFLHAITAPYAGRPAALDAALAQMSYPIPIFISTNPASHMPARRSKELSRVEDREARKEHARLSRRFDLKQLRKINV